LASACRNPTLLWQFMANLIRGNSIVIFCKSTVGIHGAEIATCETSVFAFNCRVRSAASMVDQTSVMIPARLKHLLLFRAATPSPMWLILRFAAKFL
jgi:hypothetical protein